MNPPPTNHVAIKTFLILFPLNFFFFDFNCGHSNEGLVSFPQSKHDEFVQQIIIPTNDHSPVCPRVKAKGSSRLLVIRLFA